MIDNESLETRAVIRKLAESIEDEINDLFADGVVTTGVTKRSVCHVRTTCFGHCCWKCVTADILCQMKYSSTLCLAPTSTAVFVPARRTARSSFLCKKCEVTWVLDKEMTEVQRDLQQVTKKHKEMELLHHKLSNRKSNLVHTKAELREKLRDYQERRTHALLKIERVIQESQLETQLIKNKVKSAEDQRLGGTRTQRMTRLFANKKTQNAQLPKEFRDQSQRMQKLEEAFLKIRNSTGLSDVNEIVNKFLTRDEKYEQVSFFQFFFSIFLFNFLSFSFQSFIPFLSFSTLTCLIFQPSHMKYIVVFTCFLCSIMNHWLFFSCATQLTLHVERLMR